MFASSLNSQKEKQRGRKIAALTNIVPNSVECPSNALNQSLNSTPQKTIFKSVSRNGAEIEYRQNFEQPNLIYPNLHPDNSLFFPLSFAPHCYLRDPVTFYDYNQMNIDRFIHQSGDYLEGESESKFIRGNNIQIRKGQNDYKHCPDAIKKLKEGSGRDVSKKGDFVDPPNIGLQVMTPVICNNAYIPNIPQPVNYLLPLNAGISPITLATPISSSALIDLHQYQERVQNAQLGYLDDLGMEEKNEADVREGRCGLTIEVEGRFKGERLKSPLDHEDGACNDKPPSAIAEKLKVIKLTPEERMVKVAKYLEKRKKRNWTRKILYDCRRKVAQKRLRVKGRFVTKEQAYAAIGITAKELNANQYIKTLMASKECSIVTLIKDVKIRNIQNLLRTPKKRAAQRKRKLRNGNQFESSLRKNMQLMDINTPKNPRDNVIEIRIDNLLQNDPSKDIQANN